MANRPRALDPQASPAALFGAELRALRQRRALSLAAVGRLVHVSGDLIGKIEKADRRPQPDLVTRLDRALEAEGAIERLGRGVVSEDDRSGGFRSAADAKPVLSPDDARARLRQVIDTVRNGDHAMNDRADPGTLVSHAHAAKLVLPGVGRDERVRLYASIAEAVGIDAVPARRVLGPLPHRRRQPERRQKPLVDQCRAGLAGGLLDDQAEQRVPEIRVVSPHTRAVHQLRARQRPPQGPSIRTPHRLPHVPRRLPLDTAPVRQQRSERHLVERRSHEIPTYRGVQRERAFVHQTEHDRSGEGLGDRPDPIGHLPGGGEAPLDVRPARSSEADDHARAGRAQHHRRNPALALRGGSRPIEPTGGDHVVDTHGRDARPRTHVTAQQPSRSFATPHVTSTNSTTAPPSWSGCPPPSDRPDAGGALARERASAGRAEAVPGAGRGPA